mgnify:CR=1 FL=1
MLFGQSTDSLSIINTSIEADKLYEIAEYAEAQKKYAVVLNMAVISGRVEMKLDAKLKIIKTLQKQGLFEESFAKATKLLSEVGKEAGTSSLFYGKTLHLIADLHLIRGEENIAIKLYEESIRIKKSLGGSVVQSLINSLNKLGIAYIQAGDINRQYECFREAIELHSNNFGEFQVPVKYILPEIGDAFKKLPFHDLAINYYNQTLEFLAYFEVEGYLYNKTLSDLGWVYTKKGEYQRANDYYLQSLRRNQKVFQGDHFSNGIVYLRIGQNLENQLLYDSARVYYKHYCF